MKRLQERIDKNFIFQIVEDDSSTMMSVEAVTDTWEKCFAYDLPVNDSYGLRSAQLGALFSIKSHWTVSNESATIVMPTGTGKTETMIATIVSERIDRTIIIVPSNFLRKQTVEKILKFGILQDIGVINSKAQKPCVASLNKTPTELSDLQSILNKSNVIVTTMSLIYRFSDDYLNAICESCKMLIVDEYDIIGLSREAA